MPLDCLWAVLLLLLVPSIGPDKIRRSKKLDNISEIRSAYPHRTFTENPRGKAIVDCHSGGEAVLVVGWFRPDLFRPLITYSGTFVDQQDDDAAEETYHNSAMANEQTAAALQAKRYDWRYVFTRVTKHGDGRAFEYTLADTLLWMCRRYNAK